MDLSVDLAAVVVAALAYFLIGWLWFSPVLFMNAWAKEMKMDTNKMKNNPEGKKMMVRSMVIGFVLALLTSYILANLTNYTGVVEGGRAAIFAAWIWLGFMFPVYMGSYLWEGKSLKLVAITSGHDLVGIMVMAAILASWPA